MRDDNKPKADDADFVRCVAYFWQECRDPTRYAFWDAERCARVLPEFFHAWLAYQAYEQLADMAVKGIV